MAVAPTVAPPEVPPSAPPQRRSARRRRRGALFWVGLTAASVLFLYPFLWVLSASLKPRSQVFDNAAAAEELGARELRRRSGTPRRC